MCWSKQCHACVRIHMDCDTWYKKPGNNRFRLFNLIKPITTSYLYRITYQLVVYRISTVIIVCKGTIYLSKCSYYKIMQCITRSEVYKFRSYVHTVQLTYKVTSTRMSLASATHVSSPKYP